MVLYAKFFDEPLEEKIISLLKNNWLTVLKIIIIIGVLGGLLSSFAKTKKILDYFRIEVYRENLYHFNTAFGLLTSLMFMFFYRS
jgi:hypothetical protein